MKNAGSRSTSSQLASTAVMRSGVGGAAARKVSDFTGSLSAIKRMCRRL